MLDQKTLRKVLRQKQAVRKMHIGCLPIANPNPNRLGVQMREYVCPDRERKMLPYVSGQGQR